RRLRSAQGEDQQVMEIVHVDHRHPQQDDTLHNLRGLSRSSKVQQCGPGHIEQRSALRLWSAPVHRPSITELEKSHPVYLCLGKERARRANWAETGSSLWIGGYQWRCINQY